MYSREMEGAAGGPMMGAHGRRFWGREEGGGCSGQPWAQADGLIGGKLATRSPGGKRGKCVFQGFFFARFFKSDCGDIPHCLVIVL